ncbi:hypothetical protein BZA77DRAFT_76008 [Pyronema omphalodes]|nr:hypothetical protein BZA77DRAFT_76008 [Pyronema omphalodes]
MGLKKNVQNRQFTSSFLLLLRGIPASMSIQLSTQKPIIPPAPPSLSYIESGLMECTSSITITATGPYIQTLSCSVSPCRPSCPFLYQKLRSSRRP